MKLVNKKGFTLIEILVALTVFSLLAGVFVNFLVSAVKLQRRLLITQQLVDNASYVLEYMSRTIRMAKKATDDTCIPSGTNYQWEENSLQFINYHYECQRFFLENEQLKEEKKLKEEKNEIISSLTPNNLKVTSFNITVVGDEPNEQPLVTLYLEIESQIDVGGVKPKLILQTSISQRDLNYAY